MEVVNHVPVMNVHRCGEHACSMVIINMFTPQQRYGIAFVGPHVAFQWPFRNFDEALIKYNELLRIMGAVEEVYDEPVP